jgi:hypothetical protein
MVTQEIKDNAQKIAFLIEQYPQHTLKMIIQLLHIPSIGINAAIWYGKEQGYFSEPDGETGLCTILNPPSQWSFGKAESDLEDTILYCFEQMAKDEGDLEENGFSAWVAAYPAHDVLIAMKRLENEDKMAEYHIIDSENDYTFYTLFENLGKEWGKKQFKKLPVPLKKSKKDSK